MKIKLTKYILGILAFTFMLTGCSKNEDALSLTQNVEDIQNVGGILKFKNQAVFEATIDSLKKMDTQKQIEFLAVYNLKSYNDKLKEANSELDQLVNSTTDKTTFDTLYENYKMKYQNTFLFYDISTKFISPVSKLKDSFLKRLVNSSGEYMIGNQIIKAPTYSDIIEYNALNKTFVLDFNEPTIGTQKITASPTDNYGYVKTSKRKAIVRFGLTSSGELLANFSGQIKTWLYWTSYDTIYYLDFSINKPFFLNSQGAAQPANSPFMFTTPVESSNIDVTLGYISGTDFSGVTGVFQMWSRGIDKTDGVTGNIKFD